MMTKRNMFASILGFLMICLLATGCRVDGTEQDQDAPSHVPQNNPQDGEEGPEKTEEAEGPSDAYNPEPDQEKPEEPEPEPAVLRCATTISMDAGQQAYRLRVEERDGELIAHVRYEVVHEYDQELTHDEPKIWEGAAQAELSLDSVALEVDWGTLQVESTGTPGLFSGTASFGEHRDLAAACWTPDFNLPYAYDGERGKCLDDAGKEGLNSIPIQVLRETGRGECADLEGVELNEKNYMYPQLRGWDLRGARLSGASMHFAMLPEADLRGTDFTGFEYGYAEIDGQIDPHTVLPQNGCEVEDDRLYCAF